MQLTSKDAWRPFVYRLFYSGVLGSMIFDFFDPLRSFLVLAKLGLVFIVAAYVVDYLHITVDLKLEHHALAKPLLDFLIAVFFGAAYWCLTKTIVSPIRVSHLPGPRTTESHVTIPEFIIRRVTASEAWIYCFFSLAALALAYLIIVWYERQLDFHHWIVLSAPFVLSFGGLLLIVLRPAAVMPVTVITTGLSLMAYSVYVFYVFAVEHSDAK
jgi:hypothetical protein